ncbi:MAG: crossover junction endodeoxyribonuclease RuvC [Elusimicrobiota bacterium]
MFIKILGIDPGLANLGWGVIKIDNNNDAEFIDCGCIKTASQKSTAERLGSLYTDICKVIEKHEPEEAALEQIFFSRNVKSAIKVAQARGAVIAALNNHGLKIKGYSPLQIKKALVGTGKAKKDQVQFMVKNFLKLKKVPRSDHKTDALAAALCHSNHRNLNKILKAN